MYLLDTNVVSELRKPKPHGAVVAWVGAQDTTHLYLSAMTIAELQRGVEITREQDVEKAEQIETWLEQLIVSGQVLAMDAPVCRQWARLMHRQPDTLTEDAFIAATAIVHRLVVVTRNVRDFNALNVELFDPFESSR